MPEEDMVWLPRSELLTFEEVQRVAQVFVSFFGISSVRLTGGEPTARAHLPELVRLLRRLPVELSMTTNGSTLCHLARPLKEAGLDRVTVSLDSLRRERFFELTGRDMLGNVLAGIDAALEAGLHPLKLNAVLLRGFNDDEVVPLARFARERRATLRFIEFMPLDGAGQWSAERVVPAAEVLATLDRAFGLVPVTARGNQPAERYLYADGAGEVGVVASVTKPFCDSCDRVRLTAEGMLRSCLFAVRERDLRAVLRGGGSDEDLALAIEAEVEAKWAGHAIGKVNFVRPARSMSQIGG
jgi:cyclic pyranopterin phosphate synthase